MSARDDEAPVYPLAGEGNGEDGTLPLVMFRRGDQPGAKIVPAGRWRDWMNATVARNANRCLPLLIANESGWVLLNRAPFTATWDGGVEPSSVTLQYPGDTPPEQRLASSHFGEGILTFAFGDIFCTPPGFNTWARGPANSPKDGIGPLEGIVETDWSAAPFTMNWKFTRPGTIAFDEDEPFCQILPQRRGELERFRPAIRSLSGHPELSRRTEAWPAARVMVALGRVRAIAQGDERWTRHWHEDYFRGTAPTGESSEEHQTKLRLAPFTDE